MGFARSITSFFGGQKDIVKLADHSTRATSLACNHLCKFCHKCFLTLRGLQQHVAKRHENVAQAQTLVDKIADVSKLHPSANVDEARAQAEENFLNALVGECLKDLVTVVEDLYPLS
eukprot:190599-Prorocentrum_minimum.AAC.1